MTMTLTGFYCFSLVLRVLSMLLLGLMVLPKQYREAKVDNGLKTYRQTLLVLGVILFSSIVIPFFISINNVFGNPMRMLTDQVAVINAMNDFLIALTLYLIYNYKGGDR
jgi:hypothetical protein